MKTPGWTYLLSGLILWTIHFFALYILASVFLTTPLARALVLAVTILCLGLAGWLFAGSMRRRARDPAEKWMRSVSLCGLALAAIAILWQGLPALLA